jgi:hypothetical protein
MYTKRIQTNTTEVWTVFFMYNEEFTANYPAKTQPYQNGKTKRAIMDKYDLTWSSLDRGIHQNEMSISFKEKDN